MKAVHLPTGGGASGMGLPTRVPIAHGSGMVFCFVQRLRTPTGETPVSVEPPSKTRDRDGSGDPCHFQITPKQTSWYRTAASPDCRWRLARALLASRVARASCPWTRAKAHGRDAHATCATVIREMRPDRTLCA